jgi:hypothetical protein
LVNLSFQKNLSSPDAIFQIQFIAVKLKYKIAKTSQLDSETIIKRILQEIEQRKYGILEITENSVSFDDHTGGIVGNWEYAKRMKSGRFEIIKNGTSNIVLFEYYPIPLFEFLWVGILCMFPITVGIANKQYFVGIISIPFLAQLIFKHFNLKEIANGMLSDVVD